MLKKLALAIIGSTISSLAVAGMYSPAPVPTCIPGDVTVPCEARGWNLGVQALYLRPTYSAQKAYDLNQAEGVNRVSPEWGWSYRIEGSYHFHTGNDLTMTYLHFDNDSILGSYLGFIPFAFAAEPYFTKLKNKFDQINLVLGQHTDIGAWQKIRFYGGVQYAKFRVDANNNFMVIPAALRLRMVSGVNQYRDTDYYGVGPVMGVDYSYNLANGFSLTGNTATSLLYSISRYNSGYVVLPTGAVLLAFHHSQEAVVPSLEAKLGLKYAQEWPNGMLNLEAGYQTINYFSVLQTRRFVAFIPHQNNSNFSLYGPYFGAKWIGNV